MKTLTPGYLGISEGDYTLNAIAIGKDGYPYFLEVTEDQAERIERWATHASPLPIQDILHDLPADERELLLSGTTPEEWEEMFGNEDGDDQITFTFEPADDTGSVH